MRIYCTMQPCGFRGCSPSSLPSSARRCSCASAIERRRDKDNLAQARATKAAEFRGGYFKEQGELADVDKDRAAQAATLAAAGHARLGEGGAPISTRQKLMEDLRKKLAAAEGDVSRRARMVTVHLESEILFPRARPSCPSKARRCWRASATS